jgi:hypothetical protein
MDSVDPVTSQDEVLDKAFCSLLTIRKTKIIGKLNHPWSTTRGTSTKTNSLDEHQRIHTNNSRFKYLSTSSTSHFEFTAF